MKDEDLQNGLRRLARETRPERPLASAGEIWWRAEVIRRLVERENAVQEAERPLLWGQILGLFLVLLGLLALFVSRQPQFLALLFALGLTPLAALLAFLLLRRET
jgi:hypothetical protein